jgi:hypothetical protein
LRLLICLFQECWFLFFSWPILFAVFFIVAVSAYCIAKYDLFWHDCVKSKYGDSGVKNKDYFLFFMWLILALIISLLFCFAIPTGFTLNVFFVCFVVFWLSCQLLYKTLELGDYYKSGVNVLIFIVLFFLSMSLVTVFPLLLGLLGPSKVVLSFELFKMLFVAGLSNPVFWVQSLILSLVLSNLIFKFKYHELTVDLFGCLFRVGNLRHIAVTNDQRISDRFRCALSGNVAENNVSFKADVYYSNIDLIYRILKENPDMKIDLEQIAKDNKMSFGFDVLDTNIAEVKGKGVGDQVEVSKSYFLLLFAVYDMGAGLNRFKNDLKAVNSKESAKNFLQNNLRIRRNDEALSPESFVPPEFANNDSLIKIIMTYAQNLRNNDADNGVVAQRRLLA